MKRTYIIALVSLLVSLLAWLPAHPATVRTATETFVTNKISQAVASAALSATNYTDSATNSLQQTLMAEVSSAAQAATNYTDSAVTSATNGLISVETDPNVPAWAKAGTKPTYTLNEVAPNSENWLGVQGNAGRTIKILAQGSGSSPAGGVQVTASTLNNNNTTTYAYSGVAVKRNGVNTDFLWDESSPSGIVRRAELADVTPGDYATVSNKAMNAVQKEWYTGSGDGYTMELGDGGLFVRYVDEGEVLSTGEFWPNRIALEGDGKLGMSASDNIGFWVGDDPMGSQQSTTVYENGAIAVWDASGSLHEITIPTNQSQGTFALTSDIPGNYATVSNKAANAVQTSELSSLETDPTVPSWAKAANKPSYTASEVGAATSSDLATIAGMLNAENARFVSTNYNSASHIPSAYVEAKVDGSWLEIWNELTRWNWLTDTYLPANFYNKSQINSALEDKADRAWGFYDPMTGKWAPEDSIWLSAPKVCVCAGGAYERVAETTGYWVLTSNGMVANINGTTNGFFRISDSSNETQFEIVKGDKRTLFAHATSMQPVMGVNHYLTTYAITNAVSEPTANFARALGANEQSWHHTDPSCPFNASWNQTSANEWTLEWWPKSSEPTVFLESFYEQGGETYIRNVAPISVERGILCTDGIHKVRPVYNNGSITWEVVQ